MLIAGEMPPGNNSLGGSAVGLKGFGGKVKLDPRTMRDRIDLIRTNKKPGLNFKRSLYYGVCNVRTIKLLRGRTGGCTDMTYSVSIRYGEEVHSLREILTLWGYYLGP